MSFVVLLFLLLLLCPLVFDCYCVVFVMGCVRFIFVVVFVVRVIVMSFFLLWLLCLSCFVIVIVIVPVRL